MDARMLGEAQAVARAGPWPAFGDLAAYRGTTERAMRAARRTVDLEYRWNRRFRLWERPENDQLVEHIARLTARRRLAIEIAEGREHLLGLLCSMSRGTA
jgi:hypothetical protein